jgi:hypothetical protein
MFESDGGSGSRLTPTEARSRYSVPAAPRQTSRYRKPGDTIHLIAEATDDAALPLTRYERVVITVAE